jgi:hypothetical protein
MNYNGYGEEGPSYLDNTGPSYLDDDYGAYGEASRDVTDGEWEYRQYESGKIKIVGAPSSSKAVGNTYTKGSIWEAITNKIGSYPSEEQKRRERYGEAGGASQIITGLARGLQLPSFVESGLSTPASGAPTEGNGNGNGAPDRAKTPTWVWVTASVAGVAIVGGLIYAARNK